MNQAERVVKLNLGLNEGCHCLCKHTTQPFLTLSSQQVGIKAEEVGAEVEPTLAGHFAFPVTTGIVRDQLLLRWQRKPVLEPQVCLSELLRIIFQHVGRLPFFSNQTLRKTTFVQYRDTYLMMSLNMSKESSGHFVLKISYSDLALHKAGDVLAGVENRKGLHDILLQPIPVLEYLVLCDA